uniref:Pentatricopeptide repeat-containing protein n=1 Tax=Rhizophora mucronata TaxID=61149 RepID=A0A2P2KK36_RHIMU
MIIAYSLNNCPTDALHLFSSLACTDPTGMRPDYYSITCLLKSIPCSVSDYGNLLEDVHGFVLRNGLDADVSVENALIASCSKCCEVGLARKVFDRMTERDVVTWNSMIAGYSHGGFYKECKDLYTEMLNSSGFRPNGVTALSVLQACGQLNDLLFGVDVHKYVVDNGIELDINLRNAFIGLYAKCGSLDYARELFEDMSEKDGVSYSTLVSGYMLHGFVDKGVELFREMKRPGLNTWNSLI